MAPLTDVESFISERRNVVVAGIRRDGRPHVTPNWFHWDGACFYISTIRDRAKFVIFRRDPRATLLFDDPTGFRAVIVPATAAIREDIAENLTHFQAIRDKYGMKALSDDEHEQRLREESRVLLTFTPECAPESWTSWGLG